MEQAIEAFKEHRKELRSPMTERALGLMRKKLDSLASNDTEKIEILNQSILQGYKGIFPLKPEKGATRPGTGANAPYRQTLMPESFLNGLLLDLSGDGAAEAAQGNG